MSKMTGNVANRVRRLPKPNNAANALQPIFEAVSNGMHAIQDRFIEEAPAKGSLKVSFEGIDDPSTYTVVVEDNGIGMDAVRFEAFRTTDTDFKESRGGKGVGRLLWLDAFELIQISSVFERQGKPHRRSFNFSVSEPDLIFKDDLDNLPAAVETGTTITLTGIRGSSYGEKMPKQTAVIQKHFASHFLAEFLLEKSPKMTLSIKNKSVEFPDYVTNMVIERREDVNFNSARFGHITIVGFLMKKAASSNLDGSHQLHFVTSGRTVQTRKIDALIGVKKFGKSEDLTLHCCVSGPMLDESVNQERTHFNLENDDIEKLTRECVEKVTKKIIKGEFSTYEQIRTDRMSEFITDYPSFGLTSIGELLKNTPLHAVTNEDFARALIHLKIRADEKRKDEIQNVLNTLMEGSEISRDMDEEIRRVVESTNADDNRHLMEYVTRRKFIIEIMNALLGKVRFKDGKFDTHLEKTFHQLFCPMRVVGDGPHNAAPSSHDLWLLDERLAPAIYFASDVPTDEFLENGDKSRLDLMVWDRVHGLGLEDEEELSRIILVEFKRPERTDYKGDESIIRKMNKYMQKIKNSKVRSHTGDIVKVSKNVYFHCYVVADIVGDMEADVRNWRPSPNGRGRFDYLTGSDTGIIEIIEWKELVNDAQIRNKNFIEAARLSFEKKAHPFFMNEPSES